MNQKRTTTRPASAQRLHLGSPVKALRAVPMFSLWPGIVIAVDSPPYWQRSKVAHVTVEFSDGQQQTYSGAGISDYVLEVIEPAASDCNDHDDPNRVNRVIRVREE